MESRKKKNSVWEKNDMDFIGPYTWLLNHLHMHHAIIFSYSGPSPSHIHQIKSPWKHVLFYLAFVWKRLIVKQWCPIIKVPLSQVHNLLSSVDMLKLLYANEMINIFSFNYSTSTTEQLWFFDTFL